jgi:hypothetical protein
MEQPDILRIWAELKSQVTLSRKKHPADRDTVKTPRTERRKSQMELPSVM